MGGHIQRINMALAEFIQKRKAAEILSLFGTIEYDEDYDYKKARFNN